MKNVEKLPNMEPFDKEIVADKNAESTIGMSIYEQLVCLMKQSTQEYNNMRIL
ncbi:MAG: hypothetical protein KIC80_10565 [Brachyspira sp.]|nr:hypothetical protein [Brachyspira sp.]